MDIDWKTREEKWQLRLFWGFFSLIVELVTSAEQVAPKDYKIHQLDSIQATSEGQKFLNKYQSVV